MIKIFVPLAAAAMGFATPAASATFAFSGSYQHQNPPPAAGGRCGPALTVSFGPAIAPASGTSSLGSFSPSGSHCIVPPLPTDYTDGLFKLDFGSGDTLLGTYAGRLSATASPMQFSNLQSYLVTGGTGRFLAATGSFTGTGLVTFAPGQLPASDQQLEGSIIAAAVPEPGSWALLIAGFGLVGAVSRRKRSGLPARA